MHTNSKISYVSGSTARKYDYLNEIPKETKKEKKVNKAVVNEKMHLKTVLVISCLFVMFMIITFRYNTISSSNLELQNLKTDLSRTESNLAATTVEVEQSTNLFEIEAYAKQKLGMQKPDKNQIIYIDTSKDASVVKETGDNFLDGFFKSIMGYIDGII